MTMGYGKQYAELNRCENLSSFREWLKNEAGEVPLGAEDAPVVKTRGHD